MRTQFTLAALAFVVATGAAFAAEPMAPANTMAPASTMSAPPSGGMMTPHKPKPHKNKPAMGHGNTMAPAHAMAPANTMAPANMMGGSH